jgi:hypothetical protein
LRSKARQPGKGHGSATHPGDAAAKSIVAGFIDGREMRPDARFRSKVPQRPFSRPKSAGAAVAAPKIRCTIMLATGVE